jgi:hypothetical protein
MTTTTKVEGITIHDDGEDRETHYTYDDDLSVNIRKGWDMGGGHRQGLVLVQLAITTTRGPTRSLSSTTSASARRSRCSTWPFGSSRRFA